MSYLSKKRSFAKEQIKDTNNELNSNSELKETRQIPDSPFKAMRYDNKWIVTIGRYRATEPLNSYEECENAVYNPNWNILSCAMMAIIEATNKLKNQ